MDPHRSFGFLVQEMREIFPETFLVPLTDKITDTRETYYINRFVTGYKDNYSNCPVLKLSSNSDVRIHSYTIVNSFSGIDVQKGGSLTLEGRERISLKDDSVQEGGNLKLVSNNVELNSGFSVKKGGTLTINNLTK